MVVQVRLSSQAQRELQQIRGIRLRDLRSRVRKTLTSGAAEASENVQTVARDRLAHRTGILFRSIVGRMASEAGVLGFRVGVLGGPALAYAAVQEYGTKDKNPESPIDVIRPKRAKSLAVPVEGGAALTPSGVARFVSPRDFPRPLTFLPGKGRKLAGRLVEERHLKAEEKRAAKQGQDPDLSRVATVYLLLRSVSIQPKHFVRDGFDRTLDPFVMRLGADIERFLVEGAS